MFGGWGGGGAPLTSIDVALGQASLAFAGQMLLERYNTTSFELN